MLGNWGAALMAQAQSRHGDEADRLFQEAEEKFNEALKIKPTLHEALHNWGHALAMKAKRKSGEEAAQLLKNRLKKYYPYRCFQKLRTFK